MENLLTAAPEDEDQYFVTGPGAILAGQYRLDRLFGSQGGDALWIATDLLGANGASTRTVLVKFYGESDCYERCQDWVNKLTTVNNDHIVRMRKFGRMKSSAFMVTDSVSGERLDRWIELHPLGLSLQQAAPVLRGLVEALKALHEKGITFRTLSLANVCFNPKAGIVKLFNFNLPEETPEAQPRSCYASPSLLRGQPAAAGDDVFSLACITYELLSGHHPFGGVDAISAADAQRVAAPLEAIGVSRNDLLLRALDFHGTNSVSLDDFSAAFLASSVPTAADAAAAAGETTVPDQPRPAEIVSCLADGATQPPVEATAPLQPEQGVRARRLAEPDPRAQKEKADASGEVTPPDQSMDWAARTHSDRTHFADAHSGGTGSGSTHSGGTGSGSTHSGDTDSSPAHSSGTHSGDTTVTGLRREPAPAAGLTGSRPSDDILITPGPGGFSAGLNGFSVNGFSVNVPPGTHGPVPPETGPSRGGQGATAYRHPKEGPYGVGTPADVAASDPTLVHRRSPVESSRTGGFPGPEHAEDTLLYRRDPYHHDPYHHPQADSHRLESYGGGVHGEAPYGRFAPEPAQRGGSPQWPRPDDRPRGEGSTTIDDWRMDNIAPVDDFRLDPSLGHIGRTMPGYAPNYAPAPRRSDLPLVLTALAIAVGAVVLYGWIDRQASTAARLATAVSTAHPPGQSGAPVAPAASPGAAGTESAAGGGTSAANPSTNPSAGTSSSASPSAGSGSAANPAAGNSVAANPSQGSPSAGGGSAANPAAGNSVAANPSQGSPSAGSGSAANPAAGNSVAANPPQGSASVGGAAAASPSPSVPGPAVHTATPRSVPSAPAANSGVDMAAAARATAERVPGATAPSVPRAPETNPGVDMAAAARATAERAREAMVEGANAQTQRIINSMGTGTPNADPDLHASEANHTAPPND